MTDTIPQASPLAGYLELKDEIDEAVARVLSGGWYILGEEVRSFEREFAAEAGTGHAVGTASGTDALHLAFRTLGIGPGDTVVTVSHTATATVAAVELAGASPVLIDIDPKTYTMDPERLESFVRRARDDASSPYHNVKAVVPVHLYGFPADMPAIVDIAGRYDLAVVEDCAQAHGASIKGGKVGTWGRMATYSFYPTKNLGALGDGGACVTNDSALADRARELREYGWRERFVSSSPGMNSRLDELQAAVLRVKLRHLGDDNNRRRVVARMYDGMLADTPLVLPVIADGAVHVYHQYVVRSKRRDGLRAFLASDSIGTAIHYPAPVHLQPAYEGRCVPDGTDMSVTETVCGEILSLPMFPQLSENLVRRVCSAILRFEF